MSMTSTMPVLQLRPLSSSRGNRPLENNPWNANYCLPSNSFTHCNKCQRSNFDEKQSFAGCSHLVCDRCAKKTDLCPLGCGEVKWERFENILKSGYVARNVVVDPTIRSEENGASASFPDDTQKRIPEGLVNGDGPESLQQPPRSPVYQATTQQPQYNGRIGNGPANPFNAALTFRHFNPKLCLEHQDCNVAHCNGCNMDICNECMKASHGDHLVTYSKSRAMHHPKFQNAMNTGRSSLNDALKKMEMSRRLLRNCADMAKNNARRAEDEIMSCLKKKIKDLEDHMTKVKAEKEKKMEQYMMMFQGGLTILDQFDSCHPIQDTGSKLETRVQSVVNCVHFAQSCEFMADDEEEILFSLGNVNAVLEAISMMGKVGSASKVSRVMLGKQNMHRNLHECTLLFRDEPQNVTASYVHQESRFKTNATVSRVASEWKVSFEAPKNGSYHIFVTIDGVPAAPLGPICIKFSNGGRPRTPIHNSTALQCYSPFPLEPVLFPYILKPCMVLGGQGSDFGQLSRPWGVTCDHRGRIIIADRGNNRIQVFKPDGKFLTSFGEEGCKYGQFRRPTAVAVDSTGRLIVVDKDNHRIQFFDKNYKFVSMFGQAGCQMYEFNYPWGIAVMKNDDFVVADARNHRVVKYSREGTFIASYGFKESDGKKVLESPRGIVVFPDQSIWVSDFNQHKIVAVTSDWKRHVVVHGDGSTTGGTGLQSLMRPQGMDVDRRTGNVYATDSRNARIKVLDRRDGRCLYTIGTEGSGFGQFDTPNDVCFLPDGRFAVMDLHNNRCQIFNPFQPSPVHSPMHSPLPSPILFNGNGMQHQQALSKPWRQNMQTYSYGRPMEF